MFCLAISILYLFRPYQFIDHNKTKIVCDNNMSYEIGPNLIFNSSGKFDEQEDKNVRKLCEYAIINDLADSYKSPEKINYHLMISYGKEGSWVDAFLISIAFFLVGSTIIENLLDSFIKMKIGKTSIIILALLGGFLMFMIFLKNPFTKVYCERQMASRINNFKKAAYGFGFERIAQEEAHIKKILSSQFKTCAK